VLPQQATSKSRTTSVDTTTLYFENVVANLVASGYKEIARPDSFFDHATVKNYQKIAFYQDPNDLAKVYCAYGWDAAHRNDADTPRDAVCTHKWVATTKNGQTTYFCGDDGKQCDYMVYKEGKGVTIIICDTPAPLPSEV